MTLNRKKPRSTDICADCSAPEPGWASVNRGVYVCDECCSVHRNLGRHISQIKSLRRGQWSSALLAMVNQLATHGANNIWEYALLLDPNQTQSKSGKRKPASKDQLIPTKADFVRAKYQFLTFANRPTAGEFTSVDDLSRQLHASVRTSNLETSLRLLSLGADPNYVHPEKSSRPLQVATQSGQATQAELLIIYGADPGVMDLSGQTPVDYARSEQNADLADRLLECQYEVTDRLAFYLCGRKPDHRVGQHFLIPDLADSSLDLSELAKFAKQRLQVLPNHLFEELAMDVYDEVDRRENETVWKQSAQPPVRDQHTLPFLPVNSEFSSTRNQGRQKLARFNAREFATLIIDILGEAKRRQNGTSMSAGIGQATGTMATSVGSSSAGSTATSQKPISCQDPSAGCAVSDDEPCYDSVASDDDYSSIDMVEGNGAGGGKHDTRRGGVASPKVQRKVSTKFSATTATKAPTDTKRQLARKKTG